MAIETIIAWCDHTFNPWMGCAKVSAGCDHCYAETLSRNRMGLKVWGKDAPRQVTSRPYWRGPVKWNAEAARIHRRDRVFCGSMCDWAEAHPTADATRPALWDLIRATPWLDWLLLTKRPGRIRRCLPPDWGDGWPHVWMGTSIEDVRTAFRADHLRLAPAQIRFISYEPALGPLDDLNLDGIHWLIYGGESGPGFRAEGTPGDPHAWARAIRRRCLKFDTAFFFKQSAAPRTEVGIELDGQLARAWPRGRGPVGFEAPAPAPATATSTQLVLLPA